MENRIDHKAEFKAAQEELDKEKDVVWEFGYTDCIHESSMAAISLHRTKKGAEIAMEHHKNEAKKEFDEMANLADEDWGLKFGEHEAWNVYKREILD